MLGSGWKVILVPVLRVLPVTFSFDFGNAAGVGLLPDFAVAPDLQLQPIGKRVDDGNAHAVQAAGNFVGVAIEFAAGVQDGHDHFGGGLFFGGVHVHGNAAAVVDDGDAVVVVHDDVDLVAVAGHGFVHGVVHHFPDQVVQALSRWSSRCTSPGACAPLRGRRAP